MKRFILQALMISALLNVILFIPLTVEATHSSKTTVFQAEPLPTIAPTERWGYGLPRDIAWTDTYLAVASTAGVWIFDTADLDAAPHQLEPIDDWPTNLKVDPNDANRLAVTTGSSITLWDVANGSPLFTLRQGGNGLVAPAFSQDGTRLIASNGAQAFVWNANTGDLIQTFGNETAAVTIAALSPDGRLVVGGSREGILRLWDVDSGELLTSDFPYNPTLGLARTTVVAFTPDSQYIVGADENGHIRFWTVNSLDEYIEYERTYQGDPNTPTVLALQFLADGRFITAESSTTGGLRLWQISDEITELAEIDPPGFAMANQIAISPDNQQVAVVFNYEEGRAVDIVDIDSFAISRHLGDFHPMENFTLSPDGSLLMTEGLGNPWLYNTANSSVESILTHDMGYVTGAAISPDNTLIIACVAPPAISYDPAVEGWSPNESSEAFTLLEKFAFSSGGQCEQTYITEETIGFFSYDGLYSRSRQGGEFSLVFPIPSNDYYRTLDYETIVIGTPGSGFYLVNPDHPTDSPFITLAQGAGVTTLDKSAQQIARLDATRSEVIQVFAIHENEAVLSLVLESATPVTALSFSPDGRWLVSGQQNGEVLLWNLETGQAAARLSGKFGTIRTLIFSPDGDRLYGAGQDNVITIWTLG